MSKIILLGLPDEHRCILFTTNLGPLEVYVVLSDERHLAKMTGSGE